MIYNTITIRETDRPQAGKGKMMSMTAEELIKKYRICLSCPDINGKPDGRLHVWDGDVAKKNGDFEKIVAAKADILAVLIAEYNAEEAARQERQAKTNSILGLAEMQAAYDDIEKWRAEFDKSFDDIGGFGVRQKPQYDFKAMREQYPRAAAYLDAEEYCLSFHSAKSAAGEKALDAIINGEDYVAALERMRKEWRDYCEKNIWD